MKISDKLPNDYKEHINSIDEVPDEKKVSNSNIELESPNTKMVAQDNYLEEQMSNLLEEISDEERQLLEQENSHLYQELQSNQDEVRQITRQVIRVVL